MTTQPKFGEWIKCSERLPVEEGQYLIFPWKHTLTGRFHPYDDFQESAHKVLIKKNSWYQTDYHGFDYPIEPEYWMPLPEAPNE